MAPWTKENLSKEIEEELEKKYPKSDMEKGDARLNWANRKEYENFLKDQEMLK